MFIHVFTFSGGESDPFTMPVKVGSKEKGVAAK